MNDLIKNIFKDKRNIRIIFLIFTIIMGLLISIALFENSILLGQEYNYNYSEIGTSEYKVYLKENDYYEEEYIDENMQYVSGLIDYIDVNFNYDFKSQLSIDYLYNYDINAKIVISEKNNSDKIIYKKDDILLDRDDKLIRNNSTNSIKENIKINYEKYQAIYESFRKDYGLSVDGNLIVSLNVNTKLMNIKRFNNIDESSSVLIKIPLSSSTIDISKENLNNNKNVNITDKFEIVNKFSFAMFILFAIITFSLTIVLFIVIRVVIVEKRSPYQRSLKKILTEYDRAIVESRKGIYSLNDYKVIEVNNFEELLDARDNLNNPIIHINIKNGVESWFVLLHNDLAYRYILKENKKR